MTRTRWLPPALPILFLLVTGCESGFSLVEPPTPGHGVVVIDTNHALDSMTTLDPASRRLVTSDHCSVAQVRVAGEVSPHFHRDSDETIYIVEGGGEFLIDREWRDVTAGTLVHIPAGIPHAFVNRAPSATVAITTHTPPLIEADRHPVQYEY